MATPEGKIKAKIKQVLKSYENLYYEMPVPSGYGKSGLDFHGCFHGVYFAIEAKAPGEKPTKLQENTIRRIQEAGGLAFIIDGDEGIRRLQRALDFTWSMAT